MQIIHIPRHSIASFIRLYQAILSPDHSPVVARWFPYGYCRFIPSCSEYGRMAILKHGAFVGVVRTLWRIFRCNPWSRGGADEP